jgi:hypothetical protein
VGVPALALAIVAAAAAALFELRPFLSAFHTWVFTVAAALAALIMIAAGLSSARSAEPETRFAALGSLGGALLAGSIAVAAFLVGPPHIVFGVPGQMQRVGPSGTISYPELSERDLAAGASRDSVTVSGGGRSTQLEAGSVTRLGWYVFAARSGPIAYVRAQAPNGSPATITQPTGASFVSPYLLFPQPRGEQVADAFAVPALHRTVRAVYYSGLPERGITTPFVLLEVSEENGAALARGVIVSGKPFAAPGVKLAFELGAYPIVSVASAPDVLPFIAGLAMLAIALIGFAITSLKRKMT